LRRTAGCPYGDPMRVLGVCLAALVGLLIPSGATAAPTWLPPVTLSAGDENYPSDLGIAPDGTVIAVWQQAVCRNIGEGQECENGHVQYSVRPPGGSFSPATDIYGDPVASNFSTPQVEVDGGGNALAVWQSGIGEGARILYSVRPAGGAFEDAQAIPDDEGTFQRFPDLAMGSDGRAVITFMHRIEGVDHAAYVIRPAGAGFGEARSFAGDPGTAVFDTPEVALDGGGGGIAHWSSNSPGTTIRYARLPAGATQFDAAQAIEKGSDARLAVAASGTAVMVWSNTLGAADLRYAFGSTGSGFGAPETLKEPDGPLVRRVAIAPDGSAVMAWTALVAPDSFVRWAAAPPGGPFGSPSPMPPGGEGVLGDLAVSGQGTAVAVWLDTATPPHEMQASLRPPGGVFGAPTPLPGPPQGANLFGSSARFDPQGNAVALWSGTDPFSMEPHDVPLLAAGLDAAGPRLQALDIPAGGRDDRPLSMSMVPVDVWSAVTSTSFSFGDGAGAPGPVAQHRYEAGTYTVQATATDAVGNSSMADRR